MNPLFQGSFIENYSPFKGKHFICRTLSCGHPQSSFQINSQRSVCFVSALVIRDSCYENYECFEGWYQTSHTIIATHTRVNTLRDCAAECCKNKECVSYEWQRNTRYCWIMSSWFEKFQFSAYNNRILCQLKQGRHIGITGNY